MRLRIEGEGVLVGSGVGNGGRGARGAKMGEDTVARTPIHPGEVLGDELDEIGLSAKRLADLIQVPPNRVYRLLSGKRSVTADTALRLSQYFGTSADFWMNLQSSYELDLARQQVGKAVQRIPKRGETMDPRLVG